MKSVLESSWELSRTALRPESSDLKGTVPSITDKSSE